MSIYQDDFEREVLNCVTGEGDKAEMKAVASRIAQEVTAGADLDRAITDAQFSLGLSHVGACELESDVQASMTKGFGKLAGLKGTLRKLRRQLNSMDADEVAGINELLNAIEGIEKQLTQKQEAKEERSRKKQEKMDAEPPVGELDILEISSDEPPVGDSLTDEPAEEDESEEPEEEGSDEGGEEASPFPKAEASLKKSAMPPADPDASMPDVPSEHPEPVGPQEPLTPGPEMMETRIDLKSQLQDLAAQLDQIKGEFIERTGMDELMTQVGDEEPLLREWLDTLPEKRELMDVAGEKWSMMSIAQKSTPKALQILKTFEKRIADEVKKGTDNAQKFLNMLRGLKNTPDMQINKKPYIKTDPTPKGLATEPHLAPPSTEASLLRSALDGDFDQQETDAFSRQFPPVAEALDSSLDNIIDLIDVAENQMQMA